MNTHRVMETGSNIALHTLALLAGVILVILGLGLGATIWGVLLGIPIGLAGVLLCLWGLAGRAATESGPSRSR
jgi:hypothetical protein